MCKAIQLRVEHQLNPLGLEVQVPRFSWQIESRTRSIRQAAYEVRVAHNEAALTNNRSLVWASGEVSSAQSTLVPYRGPALTSRQRYFWQVRLWDSTGKRSGWSAPAHWEMGLLSIQDWIAYWIEPDLLEDPTKANPAPMLRKEFHLEGTVVQARVYVTSRGLYELHLNGERVGDRLFTPGWTAYAKRLQYQTYDVTPQLRSGANALGAVLGDGWYRGTLGFPDRRNYYGDRLALLIQIEVKYSDGRTQSVVSDGSWKAATGAILSSDLYNGEVYDARLERSGWANADYDDHDWSAVKVVPAPKASLIAQVGPPVRRIAEIVPLRVFKTPGGDTVTDMGQNMTGWVRLRVSGRHSATVTLRHAEVLDKAGNFYTGNLCSAQARIQYTLKGAGTEVFEPHFTFHGFRYVAVSGFPGELTPESLTGIVIHSDVTPTSEFETSSELLNQLHHNILWSQKGNFLDIPTDCPQRDERLGWTGDAQVFSATAAFNMDVDRFFAKWLVDITLEQDPDGAVPWVVPDVFGVFPIGLFIEGQTGNIRAAGAAGWGDAATIVPWNLYLTYGDVQVLESQYSSMVKWVQYEQSRAGKDCIWKGDFQFGDWLDFFSTAKNTRFGSTSPDLIATAFYAHSVDILQRTASVLGKTDDAERYAELLEKVRDAFNRRFISSDGHVGEGTQTAYALALEFDLLPPSLRPLAADHLALDVRTRRHLTTGFLGTPHLLPALSRFGHLDEAYMLLNRQEYPSWLYPVTHGATTIWERWDGITPDGSFQDKELNSFNHYAYGAVGDWMYRVIAGIDVDPAAPGYKHILIKPHPGGGLTSAKASHLTPYGKVSSAWRIERDVFHLTTEVPPNTTATVRLPRAQRCSVLESNKPIAISDGIFSVAQVGTDVSVDIGSGEYSFSYPCKIQRV
jgi:alpha-L-rhamnosidase